MKQNPIRIPSVNFNHSASWQYEKHNSFHTLFSVMRFLVFLFACSIMGAMAAPNPNFDFTPLTYFPGSWKMVKEFYDSEVSKEYRVENYANLNITVENENELFFKYFNNQTNEIDSLLSFRSSVMGDKVMTFPPFVDIDTNTAAVLHFQPLVANSSYVLFGGAYE